MRRLLVILTLCALTPSVFAGGHITHRMREMSLARTAQGNRFVRYNCLSDAVIDSSSTRASSSRRLLPTPHTDWKAERIYKVPVILVEFSDRQFSMENPQEFYDNLFNERGYNLGHGPGCVADYFREQSGGLLNMEFDVVGPISVDDSCKVPSSDRYGKQIFREVAIKANSILNYADYDWHRQKSVTQVVFVYAGYGGNDGGSKAEGCIWPNTGSFSAFTADGVSVRNFTASAEMWSYNHLCGIGTICHEFSHSLGLPDLYPTAGDEFSVFDEWDLMDGGCYSDDGWCPPNYSVHEKELLGWFSSKKLTVLQTISDLPPLALGGEAYRITNDAHTNEYYLLENRQQQGWDHFLPGHGLTIIHVDYDKSAWMGNTVNIEPGHHRLDFFHACGHDYEYYDTLYGRGHYVDGRNIALSGSAYPFVSDTLVVDALTDTSVPVAATLFYSNGKGSRFMGKPITQIQEKDGLISFRFSDSPDAITTISSDAVPVAIYDLQGHLITNPKRGIYIVRYSDGTTKIVTH